MKTKWFKSTLLILKRAGIKWKDDNVTRMSAALAYYSIFSLAPLLVIVIGTASWAFGHEAAMGHLTGELSTVFGQDGAKFIQDLIKNATKQGSGIFATTLSLGLLFLGASGVFVELQDGLNKIWKVDPAQHSGFLGFLKDRLFTFSIVLGLGFLLLVSLIISAVLGWLANYSKQYFPETLMILAGVFNQLATFLVLSSMFAMIFKFLPDKKIAWTEVGIGSAATGLLFIVGKYFIGLYLATVAIGSAFGAAGSMAIILVWLFYTSQIVLFGAEITFVVANPDHSWNDL